MGTKGQKLRILSPEETATILERGREAVPVADIVAEFGTSKANVWRLFRENGIETRRKRFPEEYREKMRRIGASRRIEVVPAVLDEAVAFIRQGGSLREIARRLRISEDTLYTRMTELGIPRRRETVAANHARALELIKEARAKGARTLRAVADYLNDAGHSTPYGKKWLAATILKLELEDELVQVRERLAREAKAEAACRA
jgi:AcrR family transcriptional regulator